MYQVKQINILNEIEIPYSAETGFGSSYNVEDHATDYNGVVDIKEVLQDDNYIIGGSREGTVWEMGLADYHYCRNDIIFNGLGSKYSYVLNGNSQFTIHAENILGYTQINFDPEAIWLLCNVTFQNGIVCTGEMYCIKSMFVVSSPRAGVKVVARKLTENEYSEFYIAEFRYAYENVVIHQSGRIKPLDSISTANYSTKNAYGMWCPTGINVYGHIENNLGVSDNDIKEYVLENFTYGGLAVDFGSMLWRRSSQNYYQIDRQYIDLPRQSIGGNTEYFVGMKNKLFIIPFKTEEERNAVICAYGLFSYNNGVKPIF